MKQALVLHLVAVKKSQYEKDALIQRDMSSHPCRLQ